MSADLKAELKDGERRVAISLIAMLGALIEASGDVDTTEYLENNPLFGAIIETVGDFVDAAGDLVAASGRYIVSLETTVASLKAA